MEPGRRTPAPRATQVMSSPNTALSWQWHAELLLLDQLGDDEPQRKEVEVIAPDVARAVQLAISAEETDGVGIEVTGIFREGPVVLDDGQAS